MMDWFDNFVDFMFAAILTVFLVATVLATAGMSVAIIKELW